MDKNCTPRYEIGQLPSGEVLVALYAEECPPFHGGALSAYFDEGLNIRTPQALVKLQGFSSDLFTAIKARGSLLLTRVRADGSTEESGQAVRFAREA